MSRTPTVAAEIERYVRTGKSHRFDLHVDSPHPERGPAEADVVGGSVSGDEAAISHGRAG